MYLVPPSPPFFKGTLPIAWQGVPLPYIVDYIFGVPTPSLHAKSSLFEEFMCSIVFYLNPFGFLWTHLCFLGMMITRGKKSDLTTSYTTLKLCCLILFFILVGDHTRPLLGIFGQCKWDEHKVFVKLLPSPSLSIQSFNLSFRFKLFNSIWEIYIVNNTL